jgi:3,4-dihydroxy 2-butanone 4-phosphate synthase / GTP cyclohydrolase II
VDGSEHVALVAGTLDKGEPTLACVHSESILGDVFGSVRCNDCALDSSLEAIARHGSGVLVYLKGQAGRGMSLAEELTAYANTDAEACDTPAALEDASFPVDVRDCGVAAHILRDLGVPAVRLLTNTEAKVRCLKAHGIRVEERLPIVRHDGAGKAHKSQHARNGTSEAHFV